MEDQNKQNESEMDSLANGLFKKDPLQKPKKITIGFLVVGLAFLMVAAFASFHWIYSDYFQFKANEAAELKHLEEVGNKARIVEETADKKAAATEERCKERVSKTEAESKKRIATLDAEYEKKHSVAENGLAKKKADLALLLKNYQERFNLVTNDLEKTLSQKRNELAELKRQIGLLPDLNQQCMSASNACVAARKNRDNALAEARSAQDEYGKWNGKVAQAKSEYDVYVSKRDNLKKELVSLAAQTNEAAVVISRKNAEITVIEGKISLKQSALEKVNGEIEKAKNQKTELESELAKVNKKISDVKAECKKAETDREATMSEVRSAQDEVNKWNVKIGQAKIDYDAHVSRKENLKSDLDTMVTQTNNAAVAIAKVGAELAVVEGTVADKKSELEKIKGDISIVNNKKAALDSDLEKIKDKISKVKAECAKAEADRDAALNAKREAESSRDAEEAKAIAAEKARKEAEKHLSDRKKEIDDTIKAMEDVWKQKSKEVEKSVGGNN